MNKTKKIKFSEKGEELATIYLKTKNYRILSRNFHSQYGEIDIIALKNNTLVFVEVKTRSSSLEQAFNSVSISKQRKISRTASYFLSNNQEYEDYFIRFDVIGILYKQLSSSFTIKHLEDAFSPNLF